MSDPFRRLLPFLLRYQQRILLGLACVVITTAIQLLSPWVLKNAIDDLNSGVTRAKLAVYAGLCAWTLARAHARSADRIAIASYLGTSATFDEAMVSFAHRYADQNERDHAALVAAIEEGRITALAGV